MSDGLPARSIYEIINSNGGRLIMATHTQSGIRTRFVPVRHFDSGSGWFLRDMDGKITGLVTDAELCVPVTLNVTQPEAVAQRRWNRASDDTRTD